MKRPLIQAILLIVISAVIAVVANAMAGRERRLILPGFYPNALRVPPKAAPAPAPAAAKPVPTPAPAQPAEVFEPHPDTAYVEIGYDDVMQLHRQGALFLDARRSSVYEEGHIAGARPFSVWEADVDDKVMRLFDERPDPAQQNQPIVIYCSGGACEDSHMLAEKLWGIQFNNVYVYKDGYPDWVSRGGPVKQGPTP